MVNTFGEPKEQETRGFTLVENGTDSIKKAQACIKKIDGLVKGVDHTLKDAVIFLNHGIEILLKVMLAETDASLMFLDKKAYKEAKVKMLNENKKNVFEVNPKLKTVSTLTALKRLKNSCKVEVDHEMKRAIEKLNETRNKIMHFDLTLDEQEFSKKIRDLDSCLKAVNVFFAKHIKSYNIYITEARFEFTKEDEREHYEAWAEAKELGLFD